MTDQLEEILEQPYIDGRLVRLSGNVSTADQAAQRLGINKDRIIKSLVFHVDDIPYLVIVPGQRRANETKISKLMEAETANIADRDDVDSITGYTPGAVPPIGVDLTKIIEQDILDYKTVYGGGGDPETMLEINPRCIVDEDSVVGDIT